MRSNLLSLQQTQKLQDSTQLRLSTGLKVNSAIDNPSSYYTASSLNNRAEDLSALLDTMSQGIQALKATNEGLATGTKILEQASALTMQQLEKNQPIIARVKTEEDLLNAINSGKSGAIIIDGDINLAKNTSLTLKDGQSLLGAGYYDGSGTKTSLNFTVDEGDSTAIHLANGSTVAGLNINYNETAAKNYGYLMNGIIDGTGVRNAKLININMDINISSKFLAGSSLAAINLCNSSTIIDGNLAINAQAPVGSPIYGMHISGADVELKAKTNINSSSEGIRITSETNFNVYNELNMKTVGGGFYNLNSSLNFKSGSTTNLTSSSTGLYIASAYDLVGAMTVENGARLNVSVPASQKAIYQYLNVSTGKESIINYKKGAEINIYRNNATDGLWKVDNDFAISHVTKGGSGLTTNSFSGGDVTKNPAETVIKQPIFPYTEVDTLFADIKTDESAEGSYNELLSQYDSLIKDSSYKGVNMLRQENLKISFNEDSSSKIAIDGVDASAKGLGLNKANWDSQENLTKTMGELSDAINKIRSFMGEFGNYYAIVNTREDFTQNLINVLTEGADKLTLADMNAESANMLALQTRQQLAINSLSLASQAAQSVLKLF